MPVPRRPLRLSLRWKWTAALLAIGALPLAAFAWATVTIQRNGLATAEKSLQVAVLDHVGEAIDRLLDDAAEGTHRVGQLLTEGRIPDDEARLGLARDAMARSGVLAQVAIYSPAGELLDAIKRRDGVGDPEPLRQVPPGLAAGSAVWLPITYPEGSGVAVLRHVEPVAREGELRAWVIGTLTPGLLAARIGEISSREFLRADRVVLVDAALRVAAGGSEAPGTPLAGRDIFAATTIPPGALRAPFGLTTEFTDGGPVMVGTVRSLPAEGWAVAVSRPRAEAYGALTRSRRALAIAAGVFALLAIGIGAVLAARTTRPVRDLVALTRAYGRRDWSARSTVSTGDELEELGGSLTAMADDLKASELELTRRAAVETNLSRFIPAEVAKAIAEGRGRLELGGQRRAITVLFADVVSFTSFSETAPAEQVVGFLNELFTVLTEVVFRHGGTVDKFMGDSMMALFGAPSDQPDHATRAVATAEDIQRFVATSAGPWKARYGIEARLGIGIHSGEALVGNLGSETRMEYTAIGDAVNIAARLESLARPGQTLVTADVVTAVGDAFSFAPLGSHPLRGKQHPVEILELQ